MILNRIQIVNGIVFVMKKHLQQIRLLQWPLPQKKNTDLLTLN